MSTALTRVARELQPELKKWGVKVNGEARHIEWRGIAIELEYGTPAAICRRKLKKIIAAAQKLDWEARQTSLIPIDQMQVAEKNVLQPELFAQLLGYGTVQVGDTKAKASNHKFDGIVRVQVFCESCGDYFMVPNDDKLKREELQKAWPNVTFGDEYDYSIYICNKCIPEYLTYEGEEL